MTTRRLHPRWYVLRDGERAAVLESPRQEDMFWWSYEVMAASGARHDVYSPGFWQDTFAVEDDLSGVRIPGVFAGQVQPAAPGQRVWLRGFLPYSQDPAPARWTTRILSFLRRKA